MTSLNNKIKILATLWMEYRDEEALEDFIEYNDIGLPLAYFIDSEIVDISPRAEIYMNETFTLLLTALGIHDTGFDNLTQLLEMSEANN
jgi:hypothetical protein